MTKEKNETPIDSGFTPEKSVNSVKSYAKYIELIY